jgi:hypothetical protein
VSVETSDTLATDEEQRSRAMPASLPHFVRSERLRAKIDALAVRAEAGG